MERKQVTNGCSGKCCEKFTLSGTLEDLKLMKAELQRVREFAEKVEKGELEYNLSMSEQRVEFSNGYKVWPIDEEELDKLIDMLVYIGVTENDPQTGLSIERLNCLYHDVQTNEEILEYSSGHMFIQNDKVVSHIFTCKYFDFDNKVCTNYENRPKLCRNFGRGCKYEGCGFSRQYYKEQLENEKLRKSKIVD